MSKWLRFYNNAIIDERVCKFHGHLWICSLVVVFFDFTTFHYYANREDIISTIEVTLDTFQEKRLDFDTQRLRNGMDFIFHSFSVHSNELYLQLRQIAYLLQFHYTWNGLLRFSCASAVPLARVFHYLIMFCQALCHFSATSHELRWIYNQTSDHKVYERNKRWCIPCLASKVAELILKTITRNFCIELLIKIITRNYKLQLLESLIS